MNNFDMATAQALDMACRMDMGFHFVDKCWDICFDKRLERQELVSGHIADSKIGAMNKCGIKCINRFFEAQELQTEFRVERERQQMGLE